MSQGLIVYRKGRGEERGGGRGKEGAWSAAETKANVKILDGTK